MKKKPFQEFSCIQYYFVQKEIRHLQNNEFHLDFVNDDDELQHQYNIRKLKETI